MAEASKMGNNARGLLDGKLRLLKEKSSGDSLMDTPYSESEDLKFDFQLG